METLESLSDALETAGDIQSIVRTMKALSSVSIRQYERAEAAITAYSRTVDLGLTALLRRRRYEGLPFPGPDAVRGREGLIVIGSDRGLCGGYNDRIVRFATARMDGGPALLNVVGVRAAARLETQGLRVGRLHSLPGSVEGLSPLVQAVIIDIDRWTRLDGVGRVRLVHNRRVGRRTAEPRELRLLPLSGDDLRTLSETDWPGRSMPLFRMDPERLMSWLVRQRLFVMIYRALAEALACEHASRLAAMRAAERNIEERRDDLRQAYRLRRQETITRELLDVVSGYEAVSSGE